MLTFVERLAATPWSIQDEEISLLRTLNWTEDEIYHIVLGSAHFNYLNRMADGLGIELDYPSDLPQSVLPQTNRLQTNLPKTSAGELAGTSVPPLQLNSVETADSAQRSTNQTGEKGAALKNPSPDGPRHFFSALDRNPEVCRLARQWREFQLKSTPALHEIIRLKIGALVSKINWCDSCIDWYHGKLQALGILADVLSMEEYLGKRSTPADHFVLFDHAKKLTLSPWTIHQDSIAHLRQAGFDDLGILQLTMLVAYFNFENRVVLGLRISSRREGQA